MSVKGTVIYNDSSASIAPGLSVGIDFGPHEPKALWGEGGRFVIVTEGPGARDAYGPFHEQFEAIQWMNAMKFQENPGIDRAFIVSVQPPPNRRED